MRRIGYDRLDVGSLHTRRAVMARTRRGRSVPLPGQLEPRGPEPERYGYVILGAGCAGLSLCHYLLERGVDAPILILDRKQAFADDRTWCFWDVEETPFSDRAIRRWNSWSVRAEGREVVHTSRRYPYLCLTGADFYESVLGKISTHGNVTIRLGEDVRFSKELDDGVLVVTSAGSYLAGLVFDGRGLPPDSAALEEARRKGTWISQQFLGLRLRSRRPAFDPDTCTLMDFSVDQGRGLRFAYVLPFDEHEALVENVYLSKTGAPPEAHRAELSGYLQDRYGLFGGDYEVHGEEWGDIPMTAHRFRRRTGTRTHVIGTLGGETRPSTGYTFLRVQRYCRELAASLTGADGDPEGVHPWRYGPLDRVFLRLLRERPERCPGIYARMFAGTPPDPLVRFLTEVSSPLDDAGLIGTLPKLPFLRLAAGEALDRVRESL
ncbi:MAG: lycopene cyclase [Rubrobacter sp.]|nr:lycopene cyclase [Rubrobacter sp.]